MANNCFRVNSVVIVVVVTNPVAVVKELILVTALVVTAVVARVITNDGDSADGTCGFNDNGADNGGDDKQVVTAVTVMFGVWRVLMNYECCGNGGGGNDDGTCTRRG